MFKKLIDGIKSFLEDVLIETKKVTYPTKKDTIGTTTVVVVLVLITTFYLWMIDVSLSVLIAKVLP